MLLRCNPNLPHVEPGTQRKNHLWLAIFEADVSTGYLQMATVLIYLSAPEEGGETVFPLEGEHGLDRLPTIDYSSCSEGLRVCPLNKP